MCPASSATTPVAASSRGCYLCLWDPKLTDSGGRYIFLIIALAHTYAVVRHTSVVVVVVVVSLIPPESLRSVY